MYNYITMHGAKKEKKLGHSLAFGKKQTEFIDNFMLDFSCILDKQINATRSNKWRFIGNQLFLNMFRASLHPSPGEQTAYYCLCFPFLVMVVAFPESWVTRRVHSTEDVARQHPLHCAHPLYRRLGGPQGRPGRLRKISPPTGFVVSAPPNKVRFLVK